MKALLWKEYREKRMWLLLLGIATVMVVAGDIGYVFIFEGGLADLVDVVSGWSFAGVVLALFMGAGSFASELDKSAQFLLSRPVSWKKLLLAKIVVGLAIIFCAAVAAAIVFRILVPEQYARFATFDRIALGVGYAVAMMGAGYAAGLVCSASLPGSLGGVLAVIIIYAAMVAETVFWQWGSGTRWFPQWTVLVGWPLGTLIALIVTVRFGLTLPAGKRLLRYLVIPAAVALVLLPVDSTLNVTPLRLLPRSIRQSILFRVGLTSFGPDLRYAVGPFPDRWFHIVNRHGTVGVGPGSRQIRIGSQDGNVVFHWSAPGTVYRVSLVSEGAASDDAPHEPRNRIETFRLDEQLNLYQSVIPVLPEYSSLAVLIPSPSGRRVLVVPFLSNYWSGGPDSDYVKGFRLAPGADRWYVAPFGGRQTVDVVDIAKEKVIARKPVFISGADLWWQSEDEIGYLDEKGARHIVQVR